MTDINPEHFRQAKTQQLDKNHYYMTFADLKSLVHKLEREGISDDTPVVYQRINDFYFEENHWGTIKIKDEHYYTDLKWAGKLNIPTSQVVGAEAIPVFCGGMVDDVNTDESYIFFTAHY